MTLVDTRMPALADVEGKIDQDCLSSAASHRVSKSRLVIGEASQV